MVEIPNRILFSEMKHVTVSSVLNCLGGDLTACTPDTPLLPYHMAFWLRLQIQPSPAGQDGASVCTGLLELVVFKNAVPVLPSCLNATTLHSHNLHSFFLSLGFLMILYPS